MGGWQACAFERFMEGGRTKPALLTCRREIGEAEVRRRAVVKAIGHPEVTVRHLLFEYVGAKVATAYGCSAPDPMIVSVDDDFIAATVDNYSGVSVTLTPGLAFGSAFQENTIPIVQYSKCKPEHLGAAAMIYSFDMVIQNVDRRWEKTNCFISGTNEKLHLIDFEKAFTFFVPSLGVAPQAWEVSKFGYQKGHIFYSWLKGQPIDWDWVPEALDRAVTAAGALNQELPDEWSGDDLQTIVDHIESVRDNGAAFVAQLKASLE